MKPRTLILLVLLNVLCIPEEVKAQQLPELLQSVLKTDTAYQSISCKIDIILDVPGLSMPDKDIELRLEKGRKPEIKSEGLTILPKHGIIGQYREFLEVDCQVIPIREHDDTIVYKVVSLDRRTDWVTVDLAVTRADAKIHWMLISTRKNGEFLIRHFYSSDFELFPERTEISFESIPLKLPLKFMGKQEGLEIVTEENGPVTGKIILRYSEISWEKSPV